MQTGASWQAVPRSLGGVRDGLWALLLFAVGAACFAAVLNQEWIPGLWPSHTGRDDFDYNIRILKTMLLLEGGGLSLLGVTIALRGHWLRAWGGMELLERHFLRVAAVLLATHALSMAFYFPPQQVLSAEPVYTASHSAHYYHAFAAQHMPDVGWSRSGYDPYFMAGYPLGQAIDLESTGLFRFVALLPFIDLVYASKLFIVSSQILLLLLLLLTARAFGFSSAQSLLSGLLFLLYWHLGRPFLGQIRWDGQHSFLLASGLALLAAGCMVRFFLSQGLARAVSLGLGFLLLAFTGWTQPAAFLVCVPAMLLVYLVLWRQLYWRHHVAILLGVGLLWLLQGGELWHLIQNRHLMTPPSPGSQLGGIVDLLRILWRPTSGLVVAILIVALVSLQRQHRRPGISLFVLGTISLTMLALVTWGSSLPGIRRLQTNSFLVPGIWAAIVLAGPVLQGLGRWFENHVGRAALTTLMLFLLTLPCFASLLETRFYYVHRLNATLSPDFLRLMHRIETGSEVGSRVLFETSQPRWISQDRGDSELHALVPIYTKRELIGGPQGSSPLLHAHVDFGGGQLLGRPFAAWTAAELEEFLRRYNIGGAVAWSSAAQRFLETQSSSLELIDRIAGVRVYRLPEPSGPVARGQARVRARYNRLELLDIETEVLHLRYHWADNLKSMPPVPLERIVVPGDPVGFIGLRSLGQRRITLYQ